MEIPKKVPFCNRTLYFVNPRRGGARYSVSLDRAEKNFIDMACVKESDGRFHAWASLSYDTGKAYGTVHPEDAYAVSWDAAVARIEQRIKDSAATVGPAALGVLGL